MTVVKGMDCWPQVGTDDVVPQQWVRPYEKSAMVSQLSAGLRGSHTGHSAAESGLGAFASARAPIHVESHQTSESRRFRYKIPSLAPL